MRNFVNSSVKFSDFLDQVKGSTLKAYENQDLPFETLVDALKIDRNLAWSPVFQVMVGLQNAPNLLKKMDIFDSVDMEVVYTHSETTKFDLFANMYEAEGQIKGVFEYSTDLFNPETVERMIDHYKVLLHEISMQPDAIIGEYKMIESITDNASDEEAFEDFEL